MLIDMMRNVQARGIHYYLPNVRHRFSFEELDKLFTTQAILCMIVNYLISSWLQRLIFLTVYSEGFQFECTRGHGCLDTGLLGLSNRPSREIPEQFL
jgi:hypothetical protein